MNHSIHSSTTTSSNNSSIVLKQLDISPSDIETEDVIFYAKLIGIDPISEPELLWIAKAGLLSSLPDGWQAIEDQKGRLYYYDKRKKKSSWEHPSDPYYRFLVEHYRHFNISTATSNNHNNNSLLLLSGGSSLLTLDENNNNANPKLANSVTETNENDNHNGNSIVMNQYSTGSNGFSSSIANLHFFDDENGDDQNPDQENELAEADRQQQNVKNNGEKSIRTKTEENSGGGIHNQWVTITTATTTNNSSLPSSNIDLQSKSILKLDEDDDDGDEEKEAEPEASIDIESVELEIENPDQSLEEISDDVGIEEIMVVDSDEDHQSAASSKETEVEDKENVGTFPISAVPETRKIENNNDDGDAAGHDNDDEDVLIHSDLMNNLIQEDLFNQNEDDDHDQDDDDDDYQQEDSIRIFNGRYGNHNHRPRSAMVNSGNNVNSDEKVYKLSIVTEESDDGDGDEPESLLLAADDATSKAVDRRRMSQMGPINHQEPENAASMVGAKEEEVGKSSILERINEQHQSLSGSDGIEILLNNVKKEQEQQGRPAKTESSMPNDDDIDAASLLADDYDQEEFDSESNSRLNENGRVSSMMEQDKRFNEITEQMQLKITALREQIRAELNECNESLRKQMNEEIVSLNQRIESVERQNNNSVELLSRKIEELNLSLATKQNPEHPNSSEDFRKIQPEMLNNHVEDLKCKLMKELNENIEQKLMRIDVKVEKTIKERVDKISFENGQQLAMKQEQMLQRELSSLKSESINRDQIIEIAKQLYDRMNEDFRSAMIEVRQMCLKSNEQMETLRNSTDQDRNFTKVNFLRIDKNITQLELKRDVVADASNKNKSTVTKAAESTWTSEETGLQERQKKLIHDLIDLQMKSLNGRLNELNDKIESIMQQINSKLKLSDSGMATIPKRETIQSDGGEIKKETESNYTNHKMWSAIEKEEEDISNENKNIKTAIHSDIDPIVANVEDSNSKIMKVGNDDHQQPLSRNNDSTVYHNNKNNDDDISYNNKNATEIVVNCSNCRENNERKESLPVDHEQSVTETKKNRHEQLLEQCIDLKELLKLFMVSNPNPKRERKRIEPKRKPMIKSKSTNQIKNQKDERIQSEGISSDYLTEPSSNNDNQSMSTTATPDQFYVKKPQWSRSTPDLNPKHRRRDYPFGQAIIMPTNNINNNNGSKMNRSYANLSSSYGRRSEIIGRTAIRSNDVKSNSLLTTIQQTSNQLKQELKNLETLGNYSPGYDDDDWLKALHNDSRGRPSQIDSLSAYSDNINHQEDQLLMFRLRSIRDSVNDRLTKISSAIQQQKITQI